VSTGKLFRQIRGANSIRVLTFSPDGQWLATAHSTGGTHGNGSIQVWDTATWQEQGALVGHTSLVLGMAFAPDSRRLASASHDNTVKLWNLGAGR